MNEKKSKAGLIAGCALAMSLFWLMWDLFTGQVPALKEVKVFSSLWQLPFSLPRHLDAIVFPIFLWNFMKTHECLNRKIVLKLLGAENRDLLGGCMVGIILGVALFAFDTDLGLCLSVCMLVGVILSLAMANFVAGVGYAFGVALVVMILYHGIIGLIVLSAIIMAVYTAVAVKAGFRLLWSQIRAKEEKEAETSPKAVVA